MPRNLDMTALRAFVAVADSGGVTRAAGLLNLTQSAVSMQVKRLEDALGLSLFERANRKVTLTGSGEQLLSYARKILTLNDEALSRMTAEEFEGEIVLGVPHDIVYPAIPKVLQTFHSRFPRMNVQLLSSFTNRLKNQFARGEADVILTTEDHCDAGGETLCELPLIWLGAPNGAAWEKRPLPLAFEKNCIFRPRVQAALDRMGINWTHGVEADNARTIDASVSADLAVHAMIEGTEPLYMERIAHNGVLPDLGTTKVNLYAQPHDAQSVTAALIELIRNEWRSVEQAAA